MGITPKLEQEVWKAIHGHPTSYEVNKAFLLAHYRCLPSQLAQEPADEAILYWQIYNKVTGGRKSP